MKRKCEKKVGRKREKKSEWVGHKPTKLAQASRFEHGWCRHCQGSGKVYDGVCRLCKGDGKVRVTLCLGCDRKMVMDHIYDKVCSNCRCRPNDAREPYKVVFGR